MDKRKVLALIPARGGSKGILHKNIYMLNGRPMIEYTIKAALQSEIADDVIVSTDDLEIADIAKESGAQVPFLRPSNLASDDAKTIDVVLHALDFQRNLNIQYEILILLQPTSPLRNSSDIKRAYQFFLGHECRALVSVHECKPPLLIRTIDEHEKATPFINKNSTLRRQELEKYYCVNGAIYMNYVADLSADTSLNDNEYAFVMDKLHGLDIDDMEDLHIAQYFLDRCE